METLFSLSNLLVLPFWALMTFAPHWRWTKRLIASPLIAVPTALIYAALVLPQIGSLFGALANPELADIAALLGTPEGATIGWAHFLTFDLFVGRWAYLDSREKNITAWLVSPVLLTVLMLGPLGFVLYLALRAASGRLKRTITSTT
ncbi:MAG: ABA4-like family protein [Anaerolineales bacterium]